jgi:uncharacterized zinc-type alcohol dehydrogenase-like protein
LLHYDQAALKSFDFIISTISAEYDIQSYINLLRKDGQFVVVGSPPVPVSIRQSPLIGRRASVSGSLIGGIRETQEMLDFCGKKNIVCDIEKIPISEIDAAYERTVAGDVKYRFVIDIATL